MEKFEWHYAPITGDMVKKLDGVAIPFDTDATADQKMEEYHKRKKEFLDLQSEDKLALIETVRYGHELFSGHKGQVYIYVLKS